MELSKFWQEYSFAYPENPRKKDCRIAAFTTKFIIFSSFFIIHQISLRLQMPYANWFSVEQNLSWHKFEWKCDRHKGGLEQPYVPGGASHDRGKGV